MADADQVNQHGHATTYVVAGNRLRLLASGSERIETLVALIDEARHSLRILYYIYCDDAAGARLRDAMDRALDRGVALRLIIDGFGSAVPHDYFDGLTGKGATVCRFLPRFGRRYLLRNHQKLALADEARVIVGGFNIEDSYFDDAGGWRDLGLLVEGPAAKRLAGYFDSLADWTHQPKASMRDLRRALSDWSQPRGGPIRWLFGGPTRRLSPWAATLKRDMDRSRRLDMIASYFTPGPLMMRRIEAVAARGQARVITPSKVDHAAAIAGARHTYRRLLKRGVRIFEYQPLKLHTKLYVLENVVHIGSANFDVRSMFINLELMIRIEDKDFVAAMRRYFDGEIADSREVTAREHARAGWLDRLRWGMAYFIMAVLDVRVTRGLNFGVEERR